MNKLIAVLGIFMSLNSFAEEPRLDFDKLWDYKKPAETEKKFRELLPQAKKNGKSYHLQLLTQIGRTLSLQDKFDDAYQILKEVSSQLTDETKVAKVRYLLELGRTQNTEKKGELANKTFQDAFATADKVGEWGYAVDALHMIAITYNYGKLESAQEKLKWEAKAIAYAESKDSVNAKKWLGSLYFNTGWSYHDLKRYQEALDTFIKAAELDKTNKSPDWILLDDRRTVAQMKRLVGKTEEAFSEQILLEKENIEKLGKPDGFVFEELGELYLIKKDEAKSKEYFAKAYPLIKDQLKEPKYEDRLKRIKKLGGL